MKHLVAIKSLNFQTLYYDCKNLEVTGAAPEMASLRAELECLEGEKKDLVSDVAEYTDLSTLETTYRRILKQTTGREKLDDVETFVLRPMSRQLQARIGELKSRHRELVSKKTLIEALLVSGETSLSETELRKSLAEMDQTMMRLSAKYDEALTFWNQQLAPLLIDEWPITFRMDTISGEDRAFTGEPDDIVVLAIDSTNSFISDMDAFIAGLDE